MISITTHVFFERLPIIQRLQRPDLPCMKDYPIHTASDVSTPSTLLVSKSIASRQTLRLITTSGRTLHDIFHHRVRYSSSHPVLWLSWNITRQPKAGRAFAKRGRHRIYVGALTPLRWWMCVRIANIWTHTVLVDGWLQTEEEATAVERYGAHREEVVQAQRPS